ncbi:hypothetical protein PENNAL_c0031G06672 [Penicillium nalgiovense]|uniref:Uncharacterized protein n=1 Tax=Penicillium nalgiovense TaxID=60175 RepID=A0A1V6Y8H4_PENNA|nr:hypothetical protein PENNAL_c0031G06672 [Penicillium nalgiovense]
MLFSSGSSIYGRESVEVPEEKANIQSLRGEAQDLAVQTEQFHVDFLKLSRSGVFDSEIDVGNNGDDRGHDPEMIGRNIGEEGMGGPGIKVGNHIDEESDEDCMLEALA